MEIDPDSRLGRALAEGSSEGLAAIDEDDATIELTVNTFHHQAVDHSRLAPGLRAVGWAHSEVGRLVEALESRDDRWVVAVQCHPERTDSTPERVRGALGRVRPRRSRGRGRTGRLTRGAGRRPGAPAVRRRTPNRSAFGGGIVSPSRGPRVRRRSSAARRAVGGGLRCSFPSRFSSSAIGRRPTSATRSASSTASSRFTYRQFGERTHRLANALVELGVEPGDRVSFITYNTHQLLEAYYGVLEAGAVLNPINIRLTPEGDRLHPRPRRLEGRLLPQGLQAARRGADPGAAERSPAS